MNREKGIPIMSKKLLKLNVRLMFTSLIFVLFAAFVLGFFLVFIGYISWSPYIHPINYSAVINALEYLEIGLFVMAFCHAMYWSHQPALLEEICFVPRVSVIMCRLAASIFATSMACLIPCGFILISAAQQGTGPLFTLNTLCFTLIRWLTLLLTANTLGFFLGHFIKSTYAYVLAAPVTVLSCYFNQTFVEIFLGFRTSASRIVAQLLSTSDSSPATMEMDYPGSRLDLYYLLDGLFLVLACLLLIWVLNCIASKRLTAKKAAAGGGLIAAAVLTVWAFVVLSPMEYRYEEKLYPVDYEAQPYEITDYEGDFKLSEFSRFSGSFTVRPTSAQKTDTLTIRLDGCFTVDELTCGGSQVPYTRDGDYLTMEAPSGPVTFQIRYHGRPYYLSDIGCVNLFTSWLSSALPPNFAFVPLIDGDFNVKNYDLRVTSGNTVISNLDVAPEGNLYRLSGKASSICIFSGFLTEYEKDGITIYRTKYNAATDYNAVLDRALTEGNYMDSRTIEIVQGGFDKPEKAFLIYDLYGVVGFPVVYDGYILLNYGSTYS